MNAAARVPGPSTPARIGLSQIARLAQVSEATVSRVINHRHGVAPETRDRVQRVMVDLGFAPAERARMIGLIIPTLSIPIFATLVDHIEAALAPHGLQTIVCVSVPGGVQEREFVVSLCDLGIAGIIFASASNTLDGPDTQVYRLLEARRVPYTCMNGAFPGSSAPSYSSDDHYAAELAVRHLAELGHREIGIAVGPVGNRPSDTRVIGFCHAMRERGLSVEGRVIRQTYSVEGGQLAVELLLDQGVTAIVAGSDQIALGAIRGARRRGFDVPGQLSVVGYDDSPLMEFTDPPLTTVRQPVDRLARALVRGLIAQIGREYAPRGSLLYQPELILRGSTATAPPPKPHHQ
jgi:LacI family transcriptional regulator, repressor for deo operon, udp, cdd, tsx, nupC, and nupG